MDVLLRHGNMKSELLIFELTSELFSSLICLILFYNFLITTLNLLRLPLWAVNEKLDEVTVLGRAMAGSVEDRI